MRILQRLRLIGARNIGAWKNIYRHRRRLSWSDWAQAAIRFSSKALGQAFLFLTFLAGFVIPAVYYEARGRVLIGGLIDGRVVAFLSIFVAAIVVSRFGLPTSGNARTFRSWWFVGWLFALVKTVGAGIAVGSIALISQSPTEISAFIVTDDYDLNGEPHRKQFVVQYLEQIAKLDEAGLSIRHTSPSVGMVIETAYRSGVRDESAVTDALASDVMRKLHDLPRVNLSNEQQLDSLRKADGELSGSIEARLKSVRQFLSDRRGDRVVVLSSHRLPPNTTLMQSCWPMPESISAEWICANPSANNSEEITETRVLSVWLSSDPLVRPVVRVTAEAPSSVGSTSLVWKLFDKDDRNSTPLISRDFVAPTEGASPKEYLPGTQQGKGGRRFAWQFDLPRYPTKRWLTVELSTATELSHIWRRPIELHPNQLRISADEAASKLLTALPDFGSDSFPFILDQNAKSGEPGCIAAVVGPITVPPTKPTLELIPSVDSVTDVGRVKLLPAYIGTPLGAVTISPGLRDDWPALAPSMIPEHARRFAEISTAKGAVPVLYQRDASNAGWITIHMPSTVLRKSMNADAQRGHRHLVYFAGSMVERNGKRRPGWHQPYKAPDVVDPLPLSSGNELDDETLLAELASALARGGDGSSLRETPTNTAMHSIAPSVPFGMAVVLLLSSIASVALVSYVERLSHQ